MKVPAESLSGPSVRDKVVTAAEAVRLIRDGDAVVVEGSWVRFSPRSCLRHGAREAVEDEAALGVGLVEAIADHIHGCCVGNQIACVDKAPRLNTQWRLVAKVAPEQITGGDVRDVQPLGQPLRLGSLARSGRPNQDQSHGGTPSFRDIVSGCARTTLFARMDRHVRRAPRDVRGPCRVGVGKVRIGAGSSSPPITSAGWRSNWPRAADRRLGKGAADDAP
jgi:hypothetical protein